MTTENRSRDELLAEIEDLRLRLEEAEETLRAIGSGEVDAFVVSGPEGEQVFTLKGAEHPYRVLVETMNEGAATLTADGTILYCNNRLAAMLQIPLERLIGTQLGSYVSPSDRPLFAARLGKCTEECDKDEITMITGAGNAVSVLISCCAASISSNREISLVVTDLTQQKRNEEIVTSERLARSIIEQAGEAIIVCDESARVIRASLLAQQLCEENPLLKLFDESFRLHIAETGTPVSVMQVLAGETFHSIEVINEREGIWKNQLILNAAPLKGAEGNALGCVVTLTDITERERMESALRESKVRLQLFIEHAPASLAMFDTEMRYLSVSRRWLSDYDLGERDLTGESHYDVFPEVTAGWREAHRRGLAGEVLRAEADRFERADGSVQWIRWEIRPWYDAAGKIGGIVIFAEDITDIKQAEENLLLYQLLARHSRDIILLVRRDDGQILEANAAAVNTYGYEHEELLGLTVKELRAPESAKLTVAQMAEADTRGILFETVHRRKDRSTFPVEVSSQGATIGGTRTLISVIRDITERKRAEEALCESEEQFRTLADAIPQLCWMANADGWIFWYNQRWYEYTGTTAEQMEGWGWQSVHDPDVLPEVVERWQASISSGEPFDMSLPLRGNDGVFRPFLTRILPLKDSSGRVQRWFGTNTDISDLKRAEEKLQKAKDNLELLVRERTVDLEATLDNLSREMDERQHSEKLLRQSEERYRKVVEDQTEAISRFSSDGMLTYVNEVYCRIFGKTSDELLGRNWHPRAYPDDVPIIEERLLELSPSNPVVVIENRVYTDSGGVRWMQFVNRGIFNKEGRLMETQAVGRDVTERKQAEKELQLSEERYHTLFNTMTEGFCIIEVLFDADNHPVDYRFLETNPAFEVQSGLQDVQGMLMRDLAPDHEAHWFGLYGNVALTGESVHIVHEAKTLNRWYDVSAYQVGKPGSNKVAVIFNDITDIKRTTEELRESEAKYHFILDTMLEGCQIIGFDWRYLYINGAAEKQNRRPGSELLGRTVMECWPGITETGFFALEKSCMAERTTHQLDNEFTFPDGHRGWYRLTIQPVTEGVAIFSEDITERKQAEEALRASEERLRLAQDVAGIGVWEWIPQSGKSTWSPEIERIYDVAPGTLTDMEEWRKLVHPEDLARVEAETAEAIANRSRFDAEFRIVRPSGQIRWVSTLGGAIYDGSGQVIRAFGVNLDVTDRKLAEAEQQRLNARHEYLVALADALRPLTDVNEIKAKAVAVLGQHLRANRVVYAEVTPEGDVIIKRGYADGVPDIAGRYHLDDFGPALLRDIRAGRNFVNADVTIDPCFNEQEKASYRAVQAVSNINVPLLKNGRPVALLAVHQAEPRLWTDEEISLVEETADRTWATVERARAEEEARESRAILDTALASITDAFFISDAAGRFIEFNDAFATFHRFKDKDDCAKTLAEYPDIIDVFMANGDPAPLDMWAVPRALRGETVTNAEYSLRRKDTDETWVGSYSFAPIRGKDGVIVGSVVTARDITDRKRAEEELRESEARLRTTLRSTGDEIWIVDTQGRIVLLSDSVMENLGVSPDKWAGIEAALEQVEVFRPDGTPRPREDAFLSRTLLGEVIRDEVVIIRNLTTGQLRWREASGDSIRDAEGRIIGGVVVVRDITERKQLETELKQALEVANTTNDTMRRLMRTIAHEFRTPLGLLTCSVDILDRYRDRMTPEKLLEQNEQIRNSTRQLSNLVSSIASFQLTGKDRPGIPPSLLDIGDISRAIASEVETVWGTGHQFFVSIAADCGTAFMNDILFRRILQNLLSNAFRYTPANGNVSLDVRRENNKLLLEISDTGIGIPEEEQTRIFDAFYRSWNVEGRRGLGLGLSIVREALSQMGGNISVTSTMGAGTAMRVELPVLEPKAVC